MRLVLDTNVVLSAVLGESAPRRRSHVTGDKHLRNLKSFNRIPILGPADALAAIAPRN